MALSVKFNRDLAKFTARQLQAVETLKSGECKFLLYGGALGGGKSYFLRWFAVRRLLELAAMGFRNVTGMLACEDYPALKDRQLQKIETEFPEWLGKQHSDHKVYGRSFILYPDYGSGVICFRNLDQPAKYQSAEFAFIFVDELTKNVYDTFTFLRTRLRWPGIPDDQCYFIGATNPGGVGHGWVKGFWMDKTFPPEFYDPVDYTTKFHYVPAKADDNPHLDEAYWAMLNTLPENLRAAFRDGDWDIFVGQAFPEFNQTYHIEKPRQVPEHARLYMTYDWGFGAPYSCGYWWVDEDGRLHRFAELYGAVPGGNGYGLRQTDEEQAEKMKVFENTLNVGLWDDHGNQLRPITRYADPTCWNKKPDYKGGGQGPATAEVFRAFGIDLIPGDPHRHLKKRQFHARLRVKSELDPETGEERVVPPMMMISSDCKDFIRTIPNLQIDENDIEDVDTTGEDHIYDEAALMCMARPLALDKEEEKRRAAAERQKADRAKLDSTSQAAWESLDQIREEQEQQAEAERDAFSELFEGF